MTHSSPQYSTLGRIFFPYAERRTKTAIANGNRFVYYTTAETAFKMFRNREVWLRNALLMNDFSEISHGSKCVEAAYNGRAGLMLNEVLESCFPGMPSELEMIMGRLAPTIRNDTYITCFSEHDSADDLHGRLSMWRAYGGSSGVAIVINGQILQNTSSAAGANSSPVFYGNETAFATEFLSAVKNIAAETHALRALGRDVVLDGVFQMLRFAVLCTKHPTFQEEREWRAIASKTLYSPPRLRSDIEVIRGIPQRVLKIKLENAPEEGLTGLALPELVDRVIIGPCRFPEVTAMALREILTEVGMANAGDRVVIADIPLRISN